MSNGKLVEGWVYCRDCGSDTMVKSMISKSLNNGLRDIFHCPVCGSGFIKFERIE